MWKTFTTHPSTRRGKDWQTIHLLPFVFSAIKMILQYFRASSHAHASLVSPPVSHAFFMSVTLITYLCHSHPLLVTCAHHIKLKKRAPDLEFRKKKHCKRDLGGKKCIQIRKSLRDEKKVSWKRIQRIQIRSSSTSIFFLGNHGITK